MRTKVKSSGKRKTVVAGLVLTGALLCAGIGAAQAQQSHEVTAGDTLIGLAAAYGTTVDALKSANNLPDDTIYVGETLTIPAAAAGESETSKSQLENSILEKISRTERPTESSAEGLGNDNAPSKDQAYTGDAEPSKKTPGDPDVPKILPAKKQKATSSPKSWFVDAPLMNQYSAGGRYPGGYCAITALRMVLRALGLKDPGADTVALRGARPYIPGSGSDGTLLARRARELGIANAQFTNRGSLKDVQSQLARNRAVPAGGRRQHLDDQVLARIAAG